MVSRRSALPTAREMGLMARQPSMPPTSPSQEGWFYARRGQQHGPAGRQGPVSLERLKKLARKGWLTADDLVWNRDLPDWLPAADVPGLFSRRRLPALLRRADDALGRLAGTRRKRLERARKIRAAEQPTTRQPQRPVASNRKPKPQRPAVVPPPVPPARPVPPVPAQPVATPASAVAIEALPLRYLLSGFAGLLAALGTIFMLVEPSLLARLLLMGGLVLAAVGLLPEILKGLAVTGSLIGRLLVVVVGQWRAAACRRAAAQQDEALRRAAAKRQGLADDATAVASGKLHTGTRTRYEHDSLRGMVVVREPAIKLWSRPVAGFLSFMLPGLGQCYKGHILSGLVWFCCVAMGYAALIVPGLVLHLLCITAAASGANYSEPRTEVIRE